MPTQTLTKPKQTVAKTTGRPPVVAVMGHIDHGKSTLLDHIRKSNIADGEAGGITQHISAYEVEHEKKGSDTKRITFLDTPGHEAFFAMRSRGAKVADIGILVVSAEEGVKTQTLEALSAMREEKIPFVVAINKIDKPEANPERTKTSLMEHEIYIEGYGGDIPVVEVSAKTGQGVDDLIDTILLLAEMEELKGEPTAPAEGIVIESCMDPKKGVAATLLIKNGTLTQGQFVVAGGSSAPVRIMEDFLGRKLTEATFSTPVQIIGFNSLPEVGMTFTSYATKKEAESAASIPEREKVVHISGIATDEHLAVVPVVLKTDVAGTADAILHEINKAFKDKERVQVRVVHSGVGAISENDMNMVASTQDPIVIGFNVKVDPKARDFAERNGIDIKTFSVIYKITEYLEEEAEKRRPRVETEELTGSAKIIRTFSQTKHAQVIGGKVKEGKIVMGGKVKVLRRDAEIGRGKIVELQSQKVQTKEVLEGAEFGAKVETRVDIAEGDTIEAFSVVTK